jgi:glutamate synthase (NADPH/NADH) small chain
MFTRTKVRLQNPEERIKNFFEVALGYAKDKAQEEAGRCLLCKEPLCVKGCPVEIDIPAFIKLIREDKPEEALAKIKEKNNLPAVCGRVCPQEDQCEAMCILNKKKIPINIGALERYAADYGKTQDAGRTMHDARCTMHEARRRTQDAGGRIAVVGSGPAGLTIAADLAKMEYSVTLFESLHLPGGVLTYGIPEFRLPKKIVEEELEYIKNLGVEIRTDVLIGRTFTIKDLFEKQYRAIFLGLGAGLPQFLGIPGENLDRVYSANEFLTRLNLMKAYKFPDYKTPVDIGRKTVVLGGGNVSFDSARCALRLGSQVTIVYRRTEAQMPARIEEIQNAREEGVKFQLLTQPIKILGDERGFVKGLECIKMQLGEHDNSERPRPVPIKDSNFVLDADTVIVAIGQTPNPLLAKATSQLKANPDGTIAVDKNFMTSIPGVFAAGDIVSGAATVIAAMGQAKKAARAIDRYIRVTGNQIFTLVSVLCFLVTYQRWM